MFGRKLSEIRGFNWYDASFLRHFSMLAGGVAFAQLVTVATYPFLTRLFSPDEFGVLAVYASVLSVLGSVSTLRYEHAIVLPKNNQIAYAILVLCLIIVMSVGGLVGFILWLNGAWIVDTFNISNLKDFLWLIPIGVTGEGVYITLTQWAVRQKAFPQVTVTKLYQSIAQVVIQLGAGLFGGGAVGLLVGHMIGRIAGINVLGKLVWQHQVNNTQTISVLCDTVQQVAKRYQAFALWSSPATLLSTLTLELPTFLLSLLFGTQVTGWFSLPQRIVAIPGLLVGTTLAQIYSAEASAIRRKNGLPREQYQLIFKTIAGASVLAMPVTLVLIFYGPELVVYIFGVSWRPSGEFIRPIAILFFFQVLISPISSILLVLERQPLHLFNEVIRIVLICGAFALAYFFKASPLTTVTVYCITSSVLYIIYFVFCIWGIQQSSGSKTFE